MAAPPKVSFEHFLEKFPEIALPVTLTAESHHHFDKYNDPLPLLMIEQFIVPYEEDDPDDMTEYMACFRLSDPGDFHAVVYWRAALMDYHYVLATYSRRGILIDSRVIAGTFSDGQKLTQSVATINEDLGIYVVTGQADAHRTMDYTASTSTSYRLELKEDGTIENV